MAAIATTIHVLTDPEKSPADRRCPDLPAAGLNRIAFQGVASIRLSGSDPICVSDDAAFTTRQRAGVEPAQRLKTHG
jgi:hypothetical protein